MEPLKEQIERVRLMASGSDTWDLSDNDTSAIRTILEYAEHGTSCLKTHCERCEEFVQIVDMELSR